MNREQRRARASRYGRAVLENECGIAEHHASTGDRKRVWGAAKNVSQLCAGHEIYDAEYAKARLLGVVLGACAPKHRRDMRRAVEDGFRDGADDPRQAPEGGGTVLTGRADVVAAVAAVREHIATLAMPRREYVVACEFCAQAERIGKLRFDWSYREIVESTGLSRRTVTLAVQGLIGRRLLRRVRAGVTWRRTSSRTTWQLLPPKRELGQSCTSEDAANAKDANAKDAREDARGRAGVAQSGGPMPRHGVELVQSCTLTPERDSRARVDHSCTLTDPAHDIWHRRHTAWMVFCWLVAHPDAEAGASEIARAVGVHDSTVRRNLAWLETLGLASRGFAGWLLPPVLPEDVPAESWAEKRRARHRAERVQHAQALEERAKRRRGRRGDR